MIGAWLSVLVLAVAPALGADWARGAVVKVLSRRCEGGHRPFAGSGLLLNVSKKSYVLTSEHVVLQGDVDEGICHHVSSAALGRRRAHLVSADWGRGLALLELEATVPGAPGLDVFATTRARQNDPVITTGYPHGHDELIVHRAGSIVLPESPWHLLPQLRTVLELGEAHGVFGMSGSPVLAGDGNTVLGILSHQYLEQVGGRDPIVRELAPGDRVWRNQLLVIPAATVREWLAENLSGRFRPAFVRDPALQLLGRNVVFSSGLRWEATVSGRGEVGGGEGVGVGGGEGVGVGGADGQARQRHARVTIALDPVERRGAATRWYLPERRRWLDEVKLDLQRRATVEARYFVSRDLERRLQDRQWITSLADFFRKLERADLNDALEVSSPLRRPAIAPGRGTELRAVLAALQTAAVPGEAILFVKRAQLIASLVADGHADLLRRSDVAPLLDPGLSRAAWEAFSCSDRAEEFTRALELLRAVRERLSP